MRKKVFIVIIAYYFNFCLLLCEFYGIFERYTMTKYEAKIEDEVGGSKQL